MTFLSIDENNTPFVSGTPIDDWTSSATVLAMAMSNFTPLEWVQQVDHDTAKFLIKVSEWHINYLVPSMNYYHQVRDHYGSLLEEPF
jgi:hypothetical protein